MKTKRTPMAHVVEKDDSFQVQRINYITNPSILKQNKKYIQVSQEVAEDIEKNLNQNKIVDIPKSIKTITTKNIIVTDGNEFERKRSLVISKLKGLISQLMIEMNMIRMYDFIMINNKFSAMGIFIHEGNKEEQYLKIINIGEEELITDLENYLTAMDELDNINKEYKKFTSSYRKIFEAKDMEELESAIETLPYKL